MSACSPRRFGFCVLPVLGVDVLSIRVKRRRLAHVSAELVAARSLLVSVGQKTAIERIAAFLLNLHARNVNVDTEPDVVKLPMRRSDIGDMLGLTIETVSRTITKLRTMRVIDVINGTEVHILDSDRLNELAGE